MIEALDVDSFIFAINLVTANLDVPHSEGGHAIHDIAKFVQVLDIYSSVGAVDYVAIDLYVAHHEG